MARGREGVAQRGDVLDELVVHPVPRAQRREVRAVRRGEHALERTALSLGRLAQRPGLEPREDRAAVVVHDDEQQVRVRLPRPAQQPTDVVEEGEVAEQRARAPVAPARREGRAARRGPLGRASWRDRV